jgi:antibiotic biosynthesis monooxygenase (ABM) superfamily enzyme
MCLRRFLLLYLVALGLPLSAQGAGDVISFSGWLMLLVLLVVLAGFFALPSSVIILLYWVRDKISKRKA